MTRKVTFVILSYNNLNITKQCIMSIRSSCTDVDYDIVIVDNASTDDSVSWLKSQNDILLLENKENVGFTAGCNQGIKVSKADSDILLLNNDTLVPPKSISNMVNALYSDEKIGAVGPLSNNCPNYQNVLEEDITDKNYIEKSIRYTKKSGNVYEQKSWLVGFALLIKRKVLDEIGLLDEIFSPGNYEDNDICYRIIEAGYQVLLCHNSFVFHYGSLSFKKNPQRFMELLQKNERKFEIKWGIHPNKSTYVKSELLKVLEKEKKSGTKILEVGCGMGATLSRVKFLYPDMECFGIEKDANIVKLANKINNVVCADISQCNIPNEWGQFDYILIGSVLEYVDDAETVLRYLTGKLNNNGIIIGSVHNAECGVEFAEGGMNKFTLNKLLGLLLNTGIKDDNLSYVPVPSANNTRDVKNIKQYVFSSEPKINNVDLSICIITKNDCERLKRCLDSFKNIPLEVVVADTGSTDNTLNMLYTFKRPGKALFELKIVDFAWVNDFAKAKNYAVSQAKNDIVMILDSDEYFVDITNEKFRETVSYISSHKNEVVRIERVNIYERGGDNCENYEWISRIYDKRMYMYQGCIHEQLVSVDNKHEFAADMKCMPLKIIHDGYAGTLEERKAKALRNIELLKASIISNGENPYELYQLGKSYYMSGDYQEAAEYFEKAFCYDLNPKLEYVIDMVETYGYSLLNSSQCEKAMGLEALMAEFGNCADFKFLMGLVYMNNQKFEAAVDAFMSATEYKECRMKGTNSYLAYYNAGVIMECLGYTNEAVILYSKCGEYKKAKERIINLTK